MDDLEKTIALMGVSESVTIGQPTLGLVRAALVRERAARPVLDAADRVTDGWANDAWDVDEDASHWIDVLNSALDAYRAALGSAEAGSGASTDATQPQPGATEPLHEWRCPSCGATTRARMADSPADAVAPAAEPAPDRCDVYVRARNVMRAGLRSDEIDDGVIVGWWTDRHGMEHVAGVEVIGARGVEIDGRALAGAGAPEPAQDDERPGICPTCKSSQPHLHPSPDLCPDPWHKPVPTTVDGWRREVARWAYLLRNLAELADLVADAGPSAGRIADDMTRALAAGSTAGAAT